ncbi:MAG: hypothetical protein P4L49_07650 [Desulfosporosinus sp.]|nr:hypothetical protein [Desulfosporosinus sp.]
MKGYVSKWEQALNVAKTYDPLNASDEEIKRLTKQIFAKLVVGIDTTIGRVNGKLVLTRHSPKSY